MAADEGVLAGRARGPCDPRARPALYAARGDRRGRDLRFAGVGSSSGAHEHRHLVDGRVAIVALIIAYPLMFISTFFNTAIAAAASARLQGRRLSLSQALAVPASRIAQLAVWALMATIFGVVLEQLARRLPLAGAILARVVGLAWSVASLFALPILAIEGGSALHALKRSTQLVKQR